MSRKNVALNVFLLIGFTVLLTGVESDHTELYSKLWHHHSYFIPPRSNNISVSVNLVILNLLQIDTRNQEMTFSGILNLQWNDPRLSWDRFSHINRVTLPSNRIWTPKLIILNSVSDSNNLQHAGDDLLIYRNGQVDWPIFGHFKTSCTIDVTYYPFDQQTCVIKVGTSDSIIQIDLQKDTIDLDQFYMSVFWDVIEAPAYRNVYRAQNDEFPAETDATYYLVIRRKTHLLSEVFPLLAIAFLTILPAAVTRPLEKLILQVFCMAGLFAIYNDIMAKLPPTAMVIPLVSKYILALILCNVIHLTLTTIINNCRKERFEWIAQKIPVQRVLNAQEINYDEKEKQGKHNIEIGENYSNPNEQQMTTSGDRIVVICNRIILVLLILAVVISTLCFLFGYPHRN